MAEESVNVPTQEKAAEEVAPAQEKAASPENGSASEDATNGGTKESNGSAKTDSAPAAKVLKQIEFYFGDYNLPRDRFLAAEIKKDDGWIPLTTMMKFARLAKLTSEVSVVADAIKNAETTIMEVSEDMSKIRRSTKFPLPALEEDLREESCKRTIYCKGFPKDGSCTLDDLLEFFKPHGDYDAVRMRNYVDKTATVQGFKGSVLVVFKTVEGAKAFIEGPPVQYKKVYLIRKWFADYLDEKKKEIDDRKAKKLAKIEEVNQKVKNLEDLPKGNFLRLTGFSEGTYREDIKKSVIEITGDCAFVEFKSGDETAYIRFKEPDSNKAMLESLKDKLVVKGATLSVFLVEGEEEEQQLAKANEARRRAVSNFAENGGGKKRKFGGNFRGNNKRRRN